MALPKLLLIFFFFWSHATVQAFSPNARSDLVRLMSRQPVNGTAITECETTCDMAAKNLDACEVDASCLCSQRTIGQMLACGNCAVTTGDDNAAEIQGTLKEIKGVCASKSIDVGNVLITASAPPAPTSTSAGMRKSIIYTTAFIIPLSWFLVVVLVLI